MINRLNHTKAAAAAAKLLQSCPTLCDPIDSSPPGSPVPGILQARTLEWVAISFPNVWKWKVKVKSLSYVRLLATPWTVAYQAPPSMGFSRQEYWSGVPLPSRIKKLVRLKKKKTNLVRCQRAYYSACSFLWLKFDFLREQEVFEDNVKNVTKYYCCTLSWFLIFS